MKLILQTNRLLLREFAPDDAKSFFLLNSNPNVIKYTGNKPFTDIKDTETFLLNYKDYELNGYGRWAVIRKNDGIFLGWCGLKFVESVGETDIGFRFFEEFWNKGYATESAKACLDYGFNQLNLKSIIGRVMQENIASIRVLEKTGLQLEGEFNFEGNRGFIYRINKL